MKTSIIIDIAVDKPSGSQLAAELRLLADRVDTETLYDSCRMVKGGNGEIIGSITIFCETGKETRVDEAEANIYRLRDQAERGDV
jgi:hypothetical protein